jgi:hypothetical protein
VELRRVIGLLQLLHRGIKDKHFYSNCGCDGSPSFPRHAGWIDVVDVQGQSPLSVSGVLRIFDGEKAEAPSTPRTIPSVGSE